MADGAGVEVDGVVAFCGGDCVFVRAAAGGGPRGHTWRGLHVDIFPEPLLQRTPGLHVAGTKVLPSFEEFGLSSTAIHALAILRCCWEGSGGRRACSCEGEGSGGLGRGGVDAPRVGGDCR